MTNKIPVVILGATGLVGQRFVELLSNHPWFRIAGLAASGRSKGKEYCVAAQWKMPSTLPSEIAHMVIDPCVPKLQSKVAFSALDGEIAGPIEEEFARAGYVVISNARHYRMDPTVPLLIPEVNPQHLALVSAQPFSPGMIVTNPNCSVTGIALALKPLADRWGVEKVHVTTMQAISGAGYPGVASFDILDNVIPYIAGEEEKIETEILKILGVYRSERVDPYSLKISAQCNRVPVMDGHMASIAVKLKKQATAEEIIEAWRRFGGEPQEFNLPTAPQRPIHYLENEAYPQPKLHRHLDKGMAISIGRLRPCPLFDWKFTLLSHNTIRGAAGSALLNAELMLKNRYILPVN